MDTISKIIVGRLVAKACVVYKRLMSDDMERLSESWDKWYKNDVAIISFHKENQNKAEEELIISLEKYFGYQDYQMKDLVEQATNKLNSVCNITEWN